MLVLLKSGALTLSVYRRPTQGLMMMMLVSLICDHPDNQAANRSSSDHLGSRHLPNNFSQKVLEKTRLGWKTTQRGDTHTHTHTHTRSRAHTPAFCARLSSL